ncbi:MAG: 6-hydroxymethylpterin diphosphokinase MptE-like protein [Spirochaetales bacterium]
MNDPQDNDKPTVRLERTQDGFTVFHYRKALYDRRRPRSSAERRTVSTPIAENTCYLVASPILYYGVAELLDRIPASSVIRAVEFDSQLARVSQQYADREIQELVPLIANRSIGETAELIATAFHSNIRRVEIVRPTGGYGVSRQHYDRLLEILRAEIDRHWRNVATLVHFGRRWMRNTFRNLGYTASPPPSAVDVPIVVCAAGESIEKHMPSFRRYRERVHIMAVDTALGPLIENAITPDSVVAIESQVVNVGDFLAGLPESTRLFYDLTTHPSVPGLAHPALRHRLLTNFAPLAVLDRIGHAVADITTVDPFASVGLAAINLACRLSRWPVLLAGFDFAYTIGKPHARGSLSHRLALSLDTRLKPPLLYRHAMTRQSRRGRTAEGVEYTTEANLAQQATILTRAIPDDKTVYTLPRTGPPVPIDEQSLPAFLNGCERQTTQVRSKASQAHGAAADRSAGAASFLTEEVERLRRVRSHGDIAGMEYLWMDFADQTPAIVGYNRSEPNTLPTELSDLHRSLRNRVVHRAGSFLDFIETVRR